MDGLNGYPVEEIELNFAPAAIENSTLHRPVWQSALAVFWIIVFATCFYQFDLPNSVPKINRMQIWDQLPILLVNAVDPPQPAAGDPEARQLWKQAGWRNLPQRFGLYVVSLWILSGAWGWGSLALRPLKIPMLTGLERFFFSMGCGLAMIALMVLGCGLAGMLSRSMLGSLIIFGTVGEIICLVMTGRAHSWNWPTKSNCSQWSKENWPLLAVMPFLLCYLGGAFLPEVDFDVKEYHFGGPKEWFLAGQIHFLPHNVYTSFPFLTEMLTLLGMVLTNDWYWGAIAGKGVLMSFSWLTAMGLYAAGRRWFSTTVAVWAVLIHLSTPWIYRISIIAYAEGGLTFYLFAALFAVMLFVDQTRLQTSLLPRRTDTLEFSLVLKLVGLGGFLAGSAMACKYPGVVSVVIPMGLIVVGTLMRQRYSLKFLIAAGCVFSLAVMIAIGPWLLKNVIQTGNPVYPLLYSIFGGVDWDSALNAKWKHGHSPDHHHFSDLAIKFIDVTLKADWQSPLLFGLAPLAFWSRWGLARTRWLWGYVAWLFGTWWLLTHRIDRFWVPLIPVVSLLAAVGACWNQAAWWRYGLGTAAGFAMAFNFAFVTSSLCGYNAYLLDLKAAAEQTARITAPEIVTLNNTLPPGSKVLCVGEAELFDARFSYVYNTVFDHSLFEQWCGVNSIEVESVDRPLKPVAEIKRIFREHGITHVLVNWQEILRYRTTYGYTDFVSPSRFRQLQELGVLGRAWQSPGHQLFQNASPDTRRELERWGTALIEVKGNRKSYRTFEVFPVLD